MQIKPDRLAAALDQGIKPVYLVTGDEPLQLAEAGDQVRERVKAQGFAQREVFHVETGFDWNRLRAAVQTQSLFAEKILIDLHLNSTKLGKEGGAAIAATVDLCGANHLLLIRSPKIAPKSRDTRWYKAVDAQGVVVTIWPMEGGQLMGWLRQRLQSRGLETDPAGLELLAQRVEGNLLAAAQEIDKLQVLFGSGKMSLEDIMQAVADSSRFDVFKLVDRVLAGQLDRSLHILQGLRAEKTAVPVVVWALSRELRLLGQLAHSQQTTGSLDPVFRKHRVWDSRKGAYQRALHRGGVSVWYPLLSFCGRIDRCVKGLEPGDPWDKLAQLCESICMPKEAVHLNGIINL